MQVCVTTWEASLCSEQGAGLILTVQNARPLTRPSEGVGAVLGGVKEGEASGVWSPPPQARRVERSPSASISAMVFQESHTVACTERSLFTWRDPLRPTLAECVGSSSPGSRAAVHVPGDHAWGLRSPAEGHLGRFQCSAVRSETLCTSACGLCGN